MESRDPSPCDCKTCPSAGFRDRIVISLSGETKVVKGILECNETMFDCRRNVLNIFAIRDLVFFPLQILFQEVKKPSEILFVDE